MPQIGGNHAAKIFTVIVVVNRHRRKTEDVIAASCVGPAWQSLRTRKKRKRSALLLGFLAAGLAGLAHLGWSGWGGCGFLIVLSKTLFF